MRDSVDDRQLIARIAKADESAMRTLFVRHHGHVLAFCRRLLRQEAMAEEIANEVFLEVWRGAGNFQDRSSGTTWILSIAHHRCLNVLRKRRETNWNEDDAVEIADPEDDPEIVAQKMDKGEILRRCSAALSPIYREIIDLVYYHELSIGEVSAVLNIPDGTVKTRLFKARKRLEELLSEAGVDRGWP
jgi:RNA polymerase sigma-70 factor (ECF subfamily)